MSSQFSDARRSLLEKILRGEVALRPAAETDGIPRRDSNQPVPLSFSQEQVWMHAQMVPDVPLYNEPVTIHYSGDLDVFALEYSFNEILRRHEAWRTCFTLVDGEPRQDVKPEIKVSLPVIDLRTIPDEKREAAAIAIATRDAQEPLDLSQAPLFRTRLMRLADREYRLYLALSHIIFDGVAIYRVFVPELAALYKARVAGVPSPLAELPAQYPDYSLWQRKARPAHDVEKHLAYWRKQLGHNLPVLNLPTDHPRPMLQTFRGSMYPFALSRGLTEEVRALARSQGVTLFQTLLAAFAALLARYSGQDDFPIGSVTAGRDRPELKEMLGYFLNTVVLRTDLKNDPRFSELLIRVRNLTLDVLEHDTVPFGHLLHDLNVPRDLSRNPLFQVMFSLEPPMREFAPGWRLTQMDVDTGATKYDLYLELDERQDEILARFHYSTDLFDHSTMVRMGEQWMRLVEGAAADPEQRISQLPILSDQERTKNLFEWNRTDASSSAETKTVHQAFDQQCERTPNAVAIREGAKYFTYCQLQDRSKRLAMYLRKLGAGPETRVALCIDRSLDLYVAMLGILRTGAAYVPLDPSYPPARIEAMLQDSDPVLMITEHKLRSNAPMHRISTVAIDADWHIISAEDLDGPAVEPQPTDRLYVLYTSGSSGRPKGVEGTHRGALNRMEWMRERYPFQPGEVCCQKTNVGFVDSVCEILSPLLAGVPSVILPQEALLDPEVMLRTLAENRVSRMVLVPSLLRALLEHAPNLGERLPHLKLWSCSGEMLPWELAKKFRKAYPGATLLNIYGSSEVAADVTWHEVTGEEADANESESATSVPIGRPIRNSQIYVLDEQMNPVPVGVRGEIYVGGAGLALGYWRQPELTAERFVENRIAPEKSGKLYRTGDLGRWRVIRGEAGKEVGELEYLGRRDSEVKVRGMRIELGEIETVLGRHEWVEEAVVELSGAGFEQRLIAYVVGKEGMAPSARELRRYVRTKLPEHMVPASFVKVEELPLLSSGKVNRRALSAVAGVSLAEQGIVAPRTEVEQKLAAMWAEVLKLKEVGVDQNFFELGGHSLLVLQVMARIRREFDVELGVRTMFEEPTIAGLGVEVEKAQATGIKSRTPALERRPRPAPNVSREALLAQLDTLSADDVETLLKDVLDSRLPRSRS